MNILWSQVEHPPLPIPPCTLSSSVRDKVGRCGDPRRADDDWDGGKVLFEVAWKSRRSFLDRLSSAFQLLTVVTLQRHFSLSISSMSGDYINRRTREESVVFFLSSPLFSCLLYHRSLPLTLKSSPPLPPSHPNALSILLSHSLFPFISSLSHLQLYLNVSDCQKFSDSRMWSHTSSNVFNHTKKCHDFFFSLFPPRGHLVLPTLRGLQRPPEKFDTRMRSFKFYHSFFFQRNVRPISLLDSHCLVLLCASGIQTVVAVALKCLKCYYDSNPY